MASLAELPNVVGFFSYSREDDKAFRGSLWALRDAIQRELSALLGHNDKNFRLWQDKDAIAPGDMWKAVITSAIEQSVFFIPIVTPRAVISKHCKFEFESFLARERELGRNDLGFPIHYIEVPALLDEAEWRADPVLSIVAERQYVEWRDYRRKAVDAPDFGQEIEALCGKIVKKLRKPWISREERGQREAEARRRAEEEDHIRQEAEAKRQAEERERLRREALAKQRAEDEAREHEQAEARKHAEDEERGRQEAGAKRQAEERKRLRRESLARQRAEDEAQEREQAEAKRRAEEKERARQEAEAKREAAEQERQQALANQRSPLTATQERALKPGDSFKEGAECPELIVVPAGRFLMGSPAGQGYDDEHPQHAVTIARPFALAKFAVTFDEWDACAARGGCRADVSDNGWGRGRRPVINVSWDDAQAYVKWLSGITGRPYRLLSEAEHEYAARAGSQTKYHWGDDIKLNGKPMANCDGCGSQWGGEQTAPVGSFSPNAFGLYDIVGNVSQWTEDCCTPSYQGAPADGSAWTSGTRGRRGVRGGASDSIPGSLRSAFRGRVVTGGGDNGIGFRVARTLAP